MTTFATRRVAACLTLAFVASACAGTSHTPEMSGFGPAPALPAPHTSLLPTINVVDAIGWSGDQAPAAAEELTVQAFARGLDHPRWLYVLPNGDVLVAETNAPARPDDNTGIRGWFFKRFQKQAGGAAPSANRITLLRDADGDGSAEFKSTFVEQLNSPFGMVLVDNVLYVADTDAIVKVPYAEGATRAAVDPARLISLPGGTLNHHWTKNVIATPDGKGLYVAIGSNSNVAENGIEAEEGRAQIWLVDLATGSHRPFAMGLRNPVGMAIEPTTGQLWVAVNERDELGNDLVPDYITSVRDGGFYGWPYSYYGQTVDERVKPQRPDLVATAIVPDYALGAHTASLGLADATGNALPRHFAQGMFIGQHGSWNRKPRSGYQVIFVPFTNGVPNGMPTVVLDGFVTDNGKAMGRPVGVALDKRGGLLVADDVGNVIWRVTER